MNILITRCLRGCTIVSNYQYVEKLLQAQIALVRRTMENYINDNRHCVGISLH